MHTFTLMISQCYHKSVQTSFPFNNYSKIGQTALKEGRKHEMPSDCCINHKLNEKTSSQ